MNETIDTGAVSEGTLLTGELLYTFANELDWVGGDPTLVKEARHILENDMQHFDMGSECVNDLIDALNDLCPEGFYFGSHPGDPACFGFWACDEEI